MKKTMVGCILLCVMLVLSTFGCARDSVSHKGKGEILEVDRDLKEKLLSEGMVFIEGGCFDMGDTFGDGDSDEKPVHEVCVDGFYMGKHEVTVMEFRKFVEDTGYKTDAEKEGWGWTLTSSGDGTEKHKGTNWQNPGLPQDENYPVVQVSWNDAMAYVEWSNRKIGEKYRLPTEAEWEYAARSGGKKNKYSWGDGKISSNIADEATRRANYAWLIWEGYDDGYVYASPVGSFEPNELGLFDMSGNVCEWIHDWYDKDYYKVSPKYNPKGPESGNYRVIRGGVWLLGQSFLRVAFRKNDIPSNRFCFIGFRLVRSK